VTKVQTIAHMLYRQLEGDLPDAGQQQMLRAWMTRHFDLGAVADELDMAQLQQLFISQPRAAALRTQWSAVFRHPDAVDAKQSRAFLRALVANFEDLRALAVAPIEAGITRAAAGALTDVRVYRPAVKHGWSIQLTTAGVGEFNCVRQHRETQRGDLMLFTPNALYDYGRAQHASCWTHHWVYFQPQESWYSLLRWTEVGPGIFYLQAADEYRQLLALFKEVQSARYNRNPLALRLAANLLEQLLIRCHCLFAGTATQVLDTRVERAVAYIREHFSKALTVTDIARAAGLSASRMATLFKAQVGMPVLAYRDELRLGRACQLLVDNQLSITHVAEAVGYDDPQYFSRHFRNKLGQSPRAFRRQRLR
jgi:AraC family transcriptional regulator of arabinose operon